LRDQDSHSRLAERLAVYLVADPALTAQPIQDVVEQALDGGVTCVQLRAKSMTDREAFEIAGKLNNLCQQTGSLFVINDRVDIALAVGAAGVHLGVDDLPLQDARRLGGSGFVIGYSPETDEQVTDAAGRGADYLGVGPVFGTKSKADAGEAIGLEALRSRASLAGIPVVGIGGISPQNAAEVVAAGAVGVAVASAILRSSNPRQVAVELVSNVSRARVW